MSVFDRLFKLDSSVTAQLQKERAISIITKAVNYKVTEKEALRIYDIIAEKAMSLKDDEARVKAGMEILSTMKADWFTNDERENFVAGVWLCECGKDSKNRSGMTYINPVELEYTRKAILGTKFRSAK